VSPGAELWSVPSGRVPKETLQRMRRVLSECPDGALIWAGLLFSHRTGMSAEECKRSRRLVRLVAEEKKRRGWDR
jgi:hypothetical protein